ncbi:MAG: alpha/beta hydrolase-fold protein [Longimicrobiaceae bacterium]
MLGAEPLAQLAVLDRLAILAVILLAVAGCAPVTSRSAPGRLTAERLDRSVASEQRGRYLLYLPPGYSSDDGGRWPLLLFLHGAGERGDDLELVKLHGPPKQIAAGQELPFIVVAPQVAEGRIWSTSFLDALLEEVTERYAVDRDRISLTGLSMGGFGVWALAMEYPDRFAALVPISGGGMISGACGLKGVPIRAFHGAHDEIIPVFLTRVLVERLRECGGDARLTVYPDAGHDAWTRTYDDPALYDWLLRQRRGGGQ